MVKTNLRMYGKNYVSVQDSANTCISTAAVELLMSQLSKVLKRHVNCMRHHRIRDYSTLRRLAENTCIQEVVTTMGTRISSSFLVFVMKVAYRGSWILPESCVKVP